MRSAEEILAKQRETRTEVTRYACGDAVRAAVRATLLWCLDAEDEQDPVALIRDLDLPASLGERLFS